MKFLIPAFAALSLAGCALFETPAAPVPEPAEAAASYTPVQVVSEIATPEERAACDAAGGTLGRQGLLGWEQCVQVYPDAGKACTGEADCLGGCRYEGDAAKPGTPVSGTCQVEDVPFGCYASVENGLLQHALCVD
ncbi:hypothetical protein [Hyphomonas sp.]|uniref:hypothetical protein n=1 Tax=Hyphomonas sp. TaxID=87 RepID=UPI00391AF3A0